MSTERATSVQLLKGSELTRDLLAHVLRDAGFHVNSELSLWAPTDVTVVIAEDEDALHALGEHSAGPVVLVAPIEPDDERIAELVLDGADAVVGVQATPEELTDAVRTVAEGGTVIHPRPARVLSQLARAQRPVDEQERPTLTKREIDILLSIGRGESVKQTARALGISAKTVENLQSRLFRKLQVRNRAQAFAETHAMGLLPPLAHTDATPRETSTFREHSTPRPA